MSTDLKTCSTESACAQSSCADTLAFWVLRLWLALRAILTGIEKFAGVKIEERPLLDEFGDPDISGAIIEAKVKTYGLDYYHGLPPSLESAFAGQPLLPAWSLQLYGAVLGWALLAFGIMLLFGICTRIALFGMGLLYVSLTAGLIMIGQDAGIAWLGVHIILVALALKWVGANRCVILNKF